MSKKWKEEKARRKAAVMRTVSDEWLRQHDEQVAKAAIERYKAEMNKSIEEEWNRRAAEYVSSDMEDNFRNAIAYMFAVPVRVLIEAFGWKPPSVSRTTRTERFCEAIVEEFIRITEDEKTDVKSYAKETFDMYGIKFVNDFVYGGKE